LNWYRKYSKRAKKGGGGLPLYEKDTGKDQGKTLLKWLAGQLQSGSLTGQELKEQFTIDFCDQTPKFLILSGMGYRPESGEDLHR